MRAGQRIYPIASPLEGEVGALRRRVGGYGDAFSRHSRRRRQPPTRSFGSTSPSRGEALCRQPAGDFIR
jgi:hypothetical protein